MENRIRIGRRPLLGALALLAATPATAFAKVISVNPAATGGMLVATDLDLVPNGDGDQSAALQRAVDAAAARGLPLFLPGGSYRAGNITLATGATIFGAGATTKLVSTGSTPMFHAEGAAGVTLRDFSLDGSGGGPSDGHSGLLALSGCETLRLDGLLLQTAPGNGLRLDGCSGLVSGCSFGGCDIGIFANNSHALTLSQNRVLACGNGGILVWQDASGPDGTIVSGNHVSHILARAGGNGQNGNGINIFRADDVIVADNVIDDCDFSAVRANSTRNVAIRGNTCTNLREVAIYSEFAFSGAVIAGNIIDGAAAGISITNFNKGGQLAVCSGNIVRNITPNSPTNPDVTPYGIYAEAETAITGNTVQGVPGTGIAAGYGAFLRDVLIADNVISAVKTGVGVSVVDGAGSVRIAGNMISGATEHAVAGMKWDQVASGDLIADAGKFANVTVEGNVVSP